MTRIEHWQAWKLGERQSYPVQLASPCNLQAALDQAAAACWNRGDTLAVQHSHEGRAEHTLWLFTIKQEAKPVWRRDPMTGQPVKEQRLYAAQVSQVSLAAPFAPVEPFDALRDDAVGRDPQLVEVTL